MKFLRLALLSTLFWLAGCAVPGGNAPGETASPPATPLSSFNARPAPPPAVAPAPHVPFIPEGPLQPITASQASSRGVAQMAPPADLWERIRRGFKMQDLQGDLVHDREQWYATRPDYIQRMTERSRKYLFHIVEELELRGMPTELALLPFIESAFNPQAMSSAKAAGMWQFIPSTGKFFELKQNVFRDDRRDVLASTRAALDYLQKLYGMFGDWQLALAAYNWGEGSVGRAIAKNQRAGLGVTYLDLNMPPETRLYVPKLQAVKNIIANPKNYNVDLPLIENHPYFQTVMITRDIDVALAAKLADVPLDDFRALNPSANRPVILGANSPQILLPWDNAQVFQRNFEAYTVGQYASWTAWTAPSTMKVSDAARRVGMSEADFRGINSIPPHMMIQSGSTLLVPRSAKTETDVAAHVAENGQLALTPEIVTRRTTVKAARNETVASIARRYKVTPANVAEWNNVAASAHFPAGHQVVLYMQVRVGKASGSVARPAARGGPVRKTVRRPAAKPKRK